MPAAAESASSNGGIVDSMRSILATWVSLLRNRVELISVELEEQRAWLEQLVVLAVAAMFCITLGLILLTLLIVVAFWENHPLVVLGGFTFVYLGGGIVLWLILRARLKAKPRIFSATAAELGKDYSALQPGAP